MEESQLASLRKRAEAVLASAGGGEGDLSASDAKALIHDLRVHQIELEMQNEEIRSSRNELEIARDGYARLYNQSPIGYVSLDASGVIRKANQTFIDMAGAVPFDPQGTAFAELLGDGDREIFLGRFGAIFRHPDGKSLDLRLKAGCRASAIRLNARLESSGKTLLVAATDISEQVKVQAELREVELFWSETFEAMHDAVWILDPEGKILRFNSASERLLGKPLDDLRGCFCYEAMHDADIRVEDCPYLRMKVSMKREHHVFRVAERWFEASVEPLRDGGGRFIGTVHISKDITERKQAEDRIRALLEEKQLLLKEVHHRIKNNMNVAAAFLSLQADQIGNEEATAALEEARRRMRRRRIISAPLYRSADIRRGYAAAYLSQLLGAISQQFETHRIRIETEIADFMLDSGILYPLGIILNELLTNAFKYAFPDGRSGRVSVVLRKDGEDAAELVVSDEGVGLPPSFGAEDAKGFGFALVRALVDQIGGSLAVRECCGAAFTVRFSVGSR